MKIKTNEQKGLLAFVIVLYNFVFAVIALQFNVFYNQIATTLQTFMSILVIELLAFFPQYYFIKSSKNKSELYRNIGISIVIVSIVSAIVVINHLNILVWLGFK